MWKCFLDNGEGWIYFLTEPSAIELRDECYNTPSVSVSTVVSSHNPQTEHFTHATLALVNNNFYNALRNLFMSQTIKKIVFFCVVFIFLAG